jgi:hypothetical protein
MTRWIDSGRPLVLRRKSPMDVKRVVVAILPLIFIGVAGAARGQEPPHAGKPPDAWHMAPNRGPKEHLGHPSARLLSQEKPRPHAQDDLDEPRSDSHGKASGKGDDSDDDD